MSLIYKRGNKFFPHGSIPRRAMRAVIVLLAVAALAYGKAVDHGEKCDCGDDDHNEENLQKGFGDLSEKMNTKINNLAAKAKFIQMKLEHGQVGDEKERRVKNLLLRVGAVKGSGCGKTFFSCGDLSNTCVSKFLVCDTQNDCPNGQDEDETTCHNPAVAGSHFEGRVIFDHCTQRRPQKIGLFISETERDHTFPSVVDVTGHLSLMTDHSEYTYKGGLVLHGKYYYARQRIVFDAPEDDGLGVAAQFLPGEEDLVTIDIIRESSGEVCAKADLIRV